MSIMKITEISYRSIESRCHAIKEVIGLSFHYSKMAW